MYHVQTSLFYDLRELVRNSSLLRKYFYLFQALDLSVLPNRNHGIGRTVHSQHAILLKQPKKMRCYKTFAQLPKQRMTA